MTRGVRVERPTKRAEYEIVFATTQARKCWVDLVATTRNAMADAWDALTRHPQETTQTCHQLKGNLATVAQAGTVHLIEVHTHHPNETK